MFRRPVSRPRSTRFARASRWLVSVGLAAAALSRTAAIAVVAPSCGGCLDESQVHNFAIEPAKPCLSLSVTGECYGAGLSGTNHCAEPLVIPVGEATTVTVAPGAPIELTPDWNITTDTGALSSTDHYSVDVMVGTTAVTIQFDY